MGTENKLLKRLEEKEKQLKEQIKQAKAAQAKKDTALYANKCKVIGAAILSEMEQNQNISNTLTPIIDKHTTSARDRILLGLRPHKKAETVPDNKENFALKLDQEKDK